MLLHLPGSARASRIMREQRDRSGHGQHRHSPKNQVLEKTQSDSFQG